MPDRPRAAPALLRRAYPLPVEMLILAAVIGVWQLARIPFEGSTSVSLAHARDWISLERSLHIDIEPSVLRFVHGRDWLLDGAQRFYRNMNEPAMIAFMAVARLLDPVRYPKLRSAFALLHVPALAVLALYPLAPPHWVHGIPFADGPPVHPNALRNETAAAVSLHFGDPCDCIAAVPLAATARPARLADPALPAARLRRHPRHGQPLRARHARRQRLRGSRSRRRPRAPRAPPARRPGRTRPGASRLREQASRCSRS